MIAEDSGVVPEAPLSWPPIVPQWQPAGTVTPGEQQYEPQQYEPQQYEPQQYEPQQYEPQHERLRRRHRWIAPCAIAVLTAVVAALVILNAQSLKHVGEYKSLADGQSLQIAAKDTQLRAGEARIKTLTSEAADNEAKLAQLTTQVQSQATQLASAQTVTAAQAAQLKVCQSATTEALAIDVLWTQSDDFMTKAAEQYVLGSTAAGNVYLEQSTAIVSQITALDDKELSDTHACLEYSGTV